MPVTEAGHQIGQRGQALYDQTLKAQVEEGNHGKFLILDVNTGDYEIDPEDLIASERLLARRPDAILFGVRIGFSAAYRLGGKADQPNMMTGMINDSREAVLTMRIQGADGQEVEVKSILDTGYNGSLQCHSLTNKYYKQK